jgi:uracil-DNA glycosylase family 4
VNGILVSLTLTREALAGVAEQVLACRRCPSMPPERRRVPGCGAIEPVLAFVGEAPGRFGGDRTGVPFSGDRSGQFLRELIAGLGLDVERDVYITNVVKCNPRDERGNNRAPTPAEVAACRPHLEAELRLLRPRVVVPLGGLACRALLHRPLCEVRMVLCEREGLQFFPLYHPSYAVSYGYPRARYREEFLALKTLRG